MSVYYRLTATVNDTQRVAHIPMDHGWLPAAMKIDDDLADTLIEIIENDENVYREFYENADDDDYAAGIEDAEVFVVSIDL